MEVAAASIAVVQIADRVLTLCKAYFDGVRDAPDDFRLIREEIISLKPVLEAIQYLATTTRSLNPRESANPSLHTVLRAMSGPRSPLEGFQIALLKLEALLPKEQNSSIPTGGKDKITLANEKSKWPFSKLASGVDTILILRPKQEMLRYYNWQWPPKKASAEKLLSELTRHKATLSLGLAVYTIQDSRDFHDKIEYLVTMPGQVKMNRILDWLVTVDISSLHDRDLIMSLSDSGQTILLDPAYVEWKELKQRILWLHGAAGPGKIVLGSKIVEDIQASCQSRPFEVCGWAYYYEQQEGRDELPDLLRWITSQLCQQLNHVPQEVRDLLQNGSSPSLMQLGVAFAAIVQRFNHVYLVIDAFEEMRNRKSMMDFILQIKNGKALEKIQLMVVSWKKFEGLQTTNATPTETAGMDRDTNVSQNRLLRRFSRPALDLTKTDQIAKLLMACGVEVYLWDLNLFTLNTKDTKAPYSWRRPAIGTVAKH